MFIKVTFLNTSLKLLVKVKVTTIKKESIPQYHHNIKTSAYPYKNIIMYYVTNLNIKKRRHIMVLYFLVES